jgi:hypothetical protein
MLPRLRHVKEIEHRDENSRKTSTKQKQSKTKGNKSNKMQLLS